MRMSAEEAFEAFMSISGAPDDHPYENPFYWAAFTFNGSSL
jgi:CHAT domain-containing protein